MFFRRKKKGNAKGDKWKKKGNAKGDKRKNKGPLQRNTAYFVPGEKVRFDLNGLPFTFGKFLATFNEDGLLFQVEDEAPMNLLNIADTVEMEVEVDRRELMGADTAEFVLQLNSDVFARYKPQILAQTDIYELFALRVDGEQPLLDLANYRLFQYKVTTQLEG